MTLNDYLQGRRKAIESNIASERIAGNDFRLSCEKTALAEITALECAIACGEIDNK
jgi:hypothetical protein